MHSAYFELQVDPKILTIDCSLKRSHFVHLDSLSISLHFFRKDKSSFWSFLHTSPVRNASGKVLFIFFTPSRCTSET